MEIGDNFCDVGGVRHLGPPDLRIGFCGFGVYMEAFFMQ